ncbi:MAG: DUF115 domain-containing protein [Spirochaetes bacterium]|nr:DUF115 domain-containing protein [Spirochaetota bacterium]
MQGGTPLVKTTGRGQNVLYRGRYLYSTIDPEGSVAERVERFSLQENTLIYIPSPALGYGIKRLIDRIPENTYILCVEADQALMRLFIDQTITDIPSDRRLSVIRTDNPSQAANFIKNIGINHIRRLKPLYLSRGYHLCRQTYDAVQQALEDAIQSYWQNRITLINMSTLWIKNIIDNLQYIKHCGSTDSIVIDKPILIIGAGPSLEDNIGIIKKFRRYFVIISVDTALPVLGAVGIKPDFIFTLDAQIGNFADFIPYRFPDAILITDITVNPVLFREISFKAVFLYHSVFAALSLFKRMKSFNLLPYSIPPLGSVGAAAVYTALHISSGPVFLAGLDFSYPKEKTHANDSTFYRLMIINSSRLSPLSDSSKKAIMQRPLRNIKTQNNIDIKSDLVLNTYARELNEILKTQNRVFNLSHEHSPLLAPVVSSENELKNMLVHSGAENSNNSFPKQKNMNFSQESVKRFLDNELTILSKSSEYISHYLNSLRSERIKEINRIKQNVNVLDYIYAGFPDAGADMFVETSFLKRLLLAVHYYTNRIYRVRKSI